jgi:hypothetical protein
LIRFSASLVVIAIGLLVAGVVTSGLLLVYLAIAVSVVALVTLAIGVFLRREELFGPASPGTGSGVPGTDLPQGTGEWVPDRAEAGSFTEVRPAGMQPHWAAGRFPQAGRPYGGAEAGPSAGHEADAAAWRGGSAGRAAGPAARSGDTLVWSRDTEGPGGGDGGEGKRPESPRAPRDDKAGRAAGPEDRARRPEPGTHPGEPQPGEHGARQAPGARQESQRQDEPSMPAGQAARTSSPPGTPGTQPDPDAARRGRAPERQPPPGSAAPGPSRPDDGTPAAAAGVAPPKAASPKDAPPDASKSRAPKPDAAGPDAPGAAAPESGSPGGPDVKVVPGVPRYHRADCILIRFLGDEDLETTSLEQARQAGCTPCRACQPDSAGTQD